ARDADGVLRRERDDDAHPVATGGRERLQVGLDPGPTTGVRAGDRQAPRNAHRAERYARRPSHHTVLSPPAGRSAPLPPFLRVARKLRRVRHRTVPILGAREAAAKGPATIDACPPRTTTASRPGTTSI